MFFEDESKDNEFSNTFFASNNKQKMCNINTDAIMHEIQLNEQPIELYIKYSDDYATSAQYTVYYIPYFSSLVICVDVIFNAFIWSTYDTASM